MNRADKEHLAKLLGMLGSDHDGEALAAARKAHQLIKAAGATWPELLGIEASPAHLALAKELLGRGRGILTAWEMGFLRSALGFSRVSPQQKSILDRLHEKVDLAEDAQNAA